MEPKNKKRPNRKALYRARNLKKIEANLDGLMDRIALRAEKAKTKNKKTGRRLVFEREIRSVPSKIYKSKKLES